MKLKTSEPGEKRKLDFYANTEVQGINQL